MAPIQIRRSRSISTPIYVAARSGSGAEVHLRVRSGSGEPKAGSGEPRMAVAGALASLFLFAVAPPGAKSLYGSLEMAKPFWGFF